MALFYCNAPPETVERLIGSRMHLTGCTGHAELCRYAANTYTYHGGAYRIYADDEEFVLDNNFLEPEKLERKVAISFSEYSTEESDGPAARLQLEVFRDHMESNRRAGQHLGLVVLDEGIVACKADAAEARLTVGIGMCQGRKAFVLLSSACHRGCAIIRELLARYELTEIASTSTSSLEHSTVKLLVERKKL
ncbi:hypothetical protein PAPHI01_1144 [Pancytospora philotis]|nr:hypothetical protein PAPHI01_1144 [Pancytospora philotis]